MKVNNIEVEKILKFSAAPAFGKYKRFFPPESVAHPAKIHTELLEYLILNYTEEGDTVLDCMCGTGSTVVLSMLKNRNAIGVDLEEKFTTWTKQAIKNVEQQQTLTPKGKGLVICGDSRKLSELLKEHEEKISSVLFSPPYGEAHQSKDLGLADGNRKDLRAYSWLKSGNQNNIENLSVGNIDNVIFSPPYKTANEGGGLNKHPPKTFRGVLRNHSFKMSDNPKQIDNLPFCVDCIITSPPFADMNHKAFTKEGAKRFLEWHSKKYGVNRARPLVSTPFEYSDDKTNIGNLPFVDTVIFSPPYADIEKRDRSKENWFDEERENLFSCGMVPIQKGYQGGEGNIGNLKFGVVLFSPPYTTTKAFSDLQFMDRTSKDFSDRIRKGEIKGHFMSEVARRRVFERCKEGEIENERNIGNLPFGFEAAIFSPPYSEIRMDGGIRGSSAGMIPYTDEPADTWRTQRDQRNIGNLQHGDIDSVIFSPPYANQEVGKGIRKNRWEKIKDKEGFKGRKEWKQGTQSHYSDSKEDIGNIKDFGISAVLMSPPYEQQLNMSRDREALLTGQIERWQKKDPNHPRLKTLEKQVERNGGNIAAFQTGYTKNKNNIGNQKKETYLNAMKTVYEQCFLVLKSHGLLILILKNFIRNKKVVKLTDHTIKLCESVGFKLKERLLFKLPTQSFWRRLYSQKYPDVDTSDLQYEHILIFEKSTK